MPQEPELGTIELARLRRFAAHLTRDAHEAEDIVQETALAFLCSPPTSRLAVGSWMYVVARRVARRLRGQRRRVSTSDILDPVQRVIPVDERLIQLRSAIVDLPAEHRTAVELRYFDGLGVDEISRRTGVGVNTVYSRLQRGHVMLRERLQREQPRRRWSVAALLGSRFGRSSSTGRVLFAGASFGIVAFVLLVAGSLFDEPETVAESIRVAQLEDVRTVVPSVTRVAQQPAPGILRTALAADANESVVVRGVVVDEFERPVAGAAISAHQAIGESVLLATSERDGSFECVVDWENRMRGPIVAMAGSVALQASRDGWGASFVHVLLVDETDLELSAPLRLSSQATDVAVRVVLPPGVLRESVSVTYAAKTANLLGGSGSLLLWAPQQTATLQSDGAHVLADLVFGEGRVVVSAPGLVSQSRPVFLDGPVALEPFRLRLGRSVEGIAVDDSGVAQAGVRVTVVATRVAREVTTTTDADGAFRLEGVRAGSQRLSFRGANGVGLDRPVDVDRREVQLGAVVLAEVVPHRFRLVDANGAPIARQVRFCTSVEVGRWARAAASNEEGWVIDEGVPTDEVEVVLLADSFHGVAGLPLMSFTLKRGEDRVVTVPANLEVAVEIAVRFDAGFVPPGTLLELIPSGATRGGRFVLDAGGSLSTLAPAGVYGVRIHAPGLGAIDVEPIEVEADALCVVEVPRLSGVTIPDAINFERVVVHACARGERNQHVQESSPARASMQFLPGDYEFMLTRTNGSVVCQTVALKPGGSVALGLPGFARNDSKRR